MASAGNHNTQRDDDPVALGGPAETSETGAAVEMSLTKAELERRLADLDAELNEVRTAKASADDRIRELEQKVVALEGKVRSLTSELHA